MPIFGLFVCFLVWGNGGGCFHGSFCLLKDIDYFTCIVINSYFLSTHWIINNSSGSRLINRSVSVPKKERLCHLVMPFKTLIFLYSFHWFDINTTSIACLKPKLSWWWWGSTRAKEKSISRGKIGLICNRIVVPSDGKVKASESYVDSIFVPFFNCHLYF